MSADGEEFPGDDMDVDEELSAQPLAKLLRNTGELMRTSDDNKSGRKRRKFRPEVLDIQKTRDIPGVQPVSFSFC
jgi:U3 small nucleolar RNA-associated protein 18